MQFDNRSIGSVIADFTNSAPNTPSVEQDGTLFTRRDILNAAQSYAAYFKSQGVIAGALIALVVVDRLKGIEAMIALWSIGAAVLFLDPRQSIEDLKAAQSNAGIDAVFTESKSFAKRGGFGLITAQETYDAPDFDAQLRAHPGDSAALVLSSSGTTGVPRYRRVSHRAFLDGLAVSEQVLNQSVPRPAISVGSLAFGAVLGHWIKQLVYGQFVLSLPLMFRTTDLHRALLRKDIQAVGLPPVVIGDLLAFHDTQPREDSGPAYPHIKHMSSTGGPISAQDLARAYEVLTQGVRNMYSMSGVGLVSVLAGRDIVEKPQSVGRPIADVSVRIADDNGDDCGVGQSGRIVAQADWRVPSVAIDTGDLGWVDADGYLFISARSAQVACRNSININLSELERDVKKLSGVRDCIAFSQLAKGSPDDLVFLAVEARGDIYELTKQIKSALASYRRPDKIMIAAALPRTASNKIALADLKRATDTRNTGFVNF